MRKFVTNLHIFLVIIIYSLLFTVIYLLFQDLIINFFTFDRSSFIYYFYREVEIFLRYIPFKLPLTFIFSTLLTSIVLIVISKVSSSNYLNTSKKLMNIFILLTVGVCITLATYFITFSFPIHYMQYDIPSDYFHVGEGVFRGFPLAYAETYGDSLKLVTIYPVSLLINLIIYTILIILLARFAKGRGYWNALKNVMKNKYVFLFSTGVFSLLISLATIVIRHPINNFGSIELMDSLSRTDYFGFPVPFYTYFSQTQVCNIMEFCNTKGTNFNIPLFIVNVVLIFIVLLLTIFVVKIFRKYVYLPEANQPPTN